MGYPGAPPPHPQHCALCWVWDFPSPALFLREGDAALPFPSGHRTGDGGDCAFHKALSCLAMSTLYITIVICLIFFMVLPGGELWFGFRWKGQKGALHPCERKKPIHAHPSACTSIELPTSCCCSPWAQGSTAGSAPNPAAYIRENHFSAPSPHPSTPLLTAAAVSQGCVGQGLVTRMLTLLWVWGLQGGSAYHASTSRLSHLPLSPVRLRIPLPSLGMLSTCFISHPPEGFARLCPTAWPTPQGVLPPPIASSTAHSSLCHFPADPKGSELRSCSTQSPILRLQRALGVWGGGDVGVLALTPQGGP